MTKTTPKMKARMLCLAILGVAFSFPAVGHADDLDTLLTQPPSASLTPGDAAHRIEMMRAFIATHPDRADEIEAYLIPFVRVTQPLPAAPTPTPAPPAAKAKPLLLLKELDGTAATMRAISYRKQGAVVVAVTDKGSHAVLQAQTVQGELPWYSEEEIESGAVDLNDLAGRYETFAKIMPAFRAVLGTESARLRKMQQARDSAVAGKRNASQARLEGATAAVYDSASGYTSAKLAGLLLAAEKVRNEMPEFAEKIDAWAAPFRAHFVKLLSGYSFVNGTWVSNAELARQAREKRQAAFLNGLDYQIGTEPFPAGAARSLVNAPLIGTILAVVAGVGLMIFGRKRMYLFFPGLALLALAPLALATIFFLATRNPALLPSTISMVDEQPLVDALSEAAGLDDGITTSQKISEAALNGFLARHVRIAPADDAGDPMDARQSMAVRLLPGRVVVFEMIRSRGLNWIVRIDLEFLPMDGKPALALTSAKIGALDCPKELALELWKNLKPQLAAILSASHVAERFSIQGPGNGVIELQSIAKSADSSAKPAGTL